MSQKHPMSPQVLSNVARGASPRIVSGMLRSSNNGPAVSGASPVATVRLEHDGAASGSTVTSGFKVYKALAAFCSRHR